MAGERGSAPRTKSVAVAPTSTSYAGWPISSTSSARYDRYTGSAATCASVLPEQYQSRSWPPAPQPRRSYSVMVTSVYDVSSGRSTSRKSRRTGSCQQTFGLVSSGWRPLRSAQPCSAQPSPAGEARTVEEDAGAVVDGGLALAVVVGLDPGACLAARRRGTASRRRLEQLDERTDPLLVVLVGEVRTERAAAVIRPVGVDAFAARPEDARPSRREPGEVAPEPLVVVGRIVELDPGAREVERHFGHDASLWPAAAALAAESAPCSARG